MLPDLLHGEETRVWGDGVYQGQTEVIREGAPRARDFTQRRCRYQGQIVDEGTWAKNRTKSKVRPRHPLLHLRQQDRPPRLLRIPLESGRL